MPHPGPHDAAPWPSGRHPLATARPLPVHCDNCHPLPHQMAAPRPVCLPNLWGSFGVGCYHAQNGPKKILQILVCRWCSRHGVIFETVGSLLSLLRTGARDAYCQFFMDTMLAVEELALADEVAVTGKSKFAALGADSLDPVEIVMGIEAEFGISVEEESAQSITTVQDAADLVEKLIENKIA